MKINNIKTKQAPIAFKNIILWRHAEAHPALAQADEDYLLQSEQRDLARTLTPKGKQQAKRMGNWLNERLPKDFLLVSSPAMRAYQTAQALKCEIMVLESLKPNANLQQVLTTLACLDTNIQNVLLVGHQPWLWQLVAHLTSFTAQEISIKKGAIWWLRLSLDITKQPTIKTTIETTMHYNITAVQSPSLLK